MAGISGQSTITNLVNYVGELYALTPEDTPFLSMCGGLTGGESTDATIFGWQTYDLRDASQPDIAEGADAPAASARTRSFVFNVVQIHHEAVETSYTKLAATGQFATTGSSHAGSVGLTGSNPIMREHDWQVEQVLKQVARDVEYSFINGVFDQPADSATGRRTRGILAAITTNATDYGTSATNATGEADDEIVTDNSHGLVTGDQIMIDSITGGTGSGLSAGDVVYVEKIDANTFYMSTSRTGASAGRISYTTDITDLDYTLLVEPTQTIVLDLMQDIWDNGGIQESETRTIFVNSALKRYLTKLFITDMGFQEMSRNVGGVNAMTFETDFGRCNLVLNRFMPKDTVLVASMEQVAPVHLFIPEKGFLFKEPLAKVGSADRDQIYGEVGLKYGVEKAHGKIAGLHGLYNPA